MSSLQQKESFTSGIDWLTILLYTILVVLGWLTIYSAVYQGEGQNIFSSTTNSSRQFQWMIASIVLASVILIIDSRFFATFAYPIFAFTCVILIGVIFLGVKVKGQQNWIRFGGFQMQPSELAKVATSLAVAKYLSTLNVDIKKWKDKIRVFLIIALPLLIIVVQGDAGSAIVFVALVLTLFRDGLESYYLIFGVGVIIISVLALIIPNFIFIGILFGIGMLFAYFNKRRKSAVKIILLVTMVAIVNVISVEFAFSKLKSHQKDRINVLIGKGGNDWNIRQSMIAIGSGGVFGKGCLNGTQTKLKFVPEQSTDFIFSSIGEEFGFLGSAILVFLYVLLFFRLIFLAERQRSKFSRMYGYSVISILFFHFLINIGMAIGVAPVIGIPLPFISYGGSSLLSFTLLLFIFIKMDAQRKDNFR
jgi:rod shape determining protein RodA